ncbi:MAG: protein kinase [Planctomycetes bacterium]|nr:protein kinase [Planctomycetota bacterium]
MTVRCPNPQCGKVVEVRNEGGEKGTRCPACQTLFTVPASEARSDSGVSVQPEAGPAAVRAEEAVGRSVGPAASPLSGGSDDPFIGTLLGGCQVLEKLGGGEMGVLYKARHESLHMDVVVKIFPRSMAEYKPSSVDRFIRAGRAMAQLDLPNVVRVFNVGYESEVHFLVMEYVPGENLKSLLAREKKLDLDLAMDIVEQILEALEAAHEAGVIHRDLKPSNVLLKTRLAGRSGRTGEGMAGSEEAEEKGISVAGVKLADLGLAKFDLAREMDTGKAVNTVSGVMMGTVDYMAPEQAEDAKHVDARADIYSLGCMLYQMLSGHKPYEAKSAMQVMLMHVQGKIPNLADERPEVPSVLPRILRKMMAKKADDRYASASEVLDALRRVRGRGASRRPSGGRPSARVADRERPSDEVVEILTRAQRLMEEKRQREALELLDEVLALDSVNGRAKEMKAEAEGIIETVGKQKAAAAAAEALENYETAREALEAALALSPQDEFLRGKLQALPGLIRQRDVRRRMSEAQAALESKSYRAALEQFESVLAMDSAHAQAALGVEQCRRRIEEGRDSLIRIQGLLEQGALTAARSASVAIMEADPDDEEVRRMLAEIDARATQAARRIGEAKGLVEQKKWSEAIPLWRDALELWKDNAEARAGLDLAMKAQAEFAQLSEEAKNFAKENNLDLAEKAVEGALGAGYWPGGAALLEEIRGKKGKLESLLGEARARVKGREWENAIDSFQKVLSFWPTCEEARAGLQTAVRSEQNFRDVVDRAVKQVQAKSLREAEELLKQAMDAGEWLDGTVLLTEVQTGISQVQEFLVAARGMVEEKKWASALEVLSKAHELWPNNPQVQEMQNTVKFHGSASKAQKLLKEKRVTSAISALEYALASGEWPEGERLLQEAQEQQRAVRGFIEAAEKAISQRSWRMAIKHFEEAKALDIEVAFPDRFRDIHTQAVKLEEQLKWLRKWFKEGRFQDVVGDAAKVGQWASDPELETVLKEASQKLKEVHAMETKAEQLEADSDPAGAVMLLERVVTIQPYRKEAMADDIQRLKNRILAGHTKLDEATKFAASKRWSDALISAREALMNDRRLSDAVSLAERAAVEEARQKQRRKTILYVVLGLVVIIAVIAVGLLASGS